MNNLYKREQEAPRSPAHFVTLSPPPGTSGDFGHIRRATELALRLGDPDAARRAALALLRHFPDAVGPLVLLGQALLDCGEPRTAVAQFRRALKLNPLDAVAWAGLAGALARCEQHDAAQAALLRAALHDPLSSESLAPGIVQSPVPLGMGVVYMRRGHAALAVPELAGVIACQPAREDMRLYYIEALRRAGGHVDARRQLQAFESADAPSLPLLLLQAALITDTAAAALARERCARYDPDHQITRRFFAPECPPWELPPPAVVAWDAEFETIARYLSHVAIGPKSAVIADNRRSTIIEEPLIQNLKSNIQNPIDPDILAVVETTEQLRHRIADVGGAPRPLIPRGAGQDHTQIMLANKSALARRYGDAGFAAIDRRLHALADALRRRGLQVQCCYSDDAASLELDNQLALAPAAHDATAIRELVRSMAEGLAQQRRPLGTLLLIGGDDIIPFHRLPNPLPDGDAAVLSDNPYGTDDAGYLLPQWTVARIPEGAGTDPTLLLGLLDLVVEYHQRGGPSTSDRWAGLPLRDFLRGTTLARSVAARGYSAEVWRETSREVLDGYAADASLACSPPLDDAAFEGDAPFGSRLLYLNLHGATGLPNWYGQPEAPSLGSASQLPVALRPDYFGNHPLVGGLLISEACYGLDLAGRTAQTSIPLRALATGALACVGATVNAYGSATTPLLGADLLCQRLLAQLQRGVSVGEALREARLEFAQTMYRRQGYLDDVDIKTLTEFVLLGDPWASLTSAAAASAWPVSKLASIERVPKPRPKAVLLEEQVSRDLVQRARAALRRILPGATTAPLRITVQPNPRQLRKGEAEQELTFSAQASHPTADGYHIAQTAHVTLNGRAVVKVALTR
jgi:tetratricopeptide (TPR) repeat protein